MKVDKSGKQVKTLFNCLQMFEYMYFHGSNTMTTQIVP